MRQCPARAVYLINEGSVSGLRRAVQEACSRWAGMTEPIVPVRPDGGVDAWWVQVAQLSKADQVVNVDVANQQAATAAQQLDLKLLQLTDIDSRTSITQFTCHPGAVEPPSVDQNAYIISLLTLMPLTVRSVQAGDLADVRVGAIQGCRSFRSHYWHIDCMILPKVRDPRLVTIRRGGTLTDTDHQLLALWAAQCAEHVLHFFEDGQPSDTRPRDAIDAARAWARGI